MKNLIFAAALLVICSGAIIRAEELDGKTLLESCSAAVSIADGKPLGDSQEEVRNVNLCTGYLYGFTDSHELEKLAKPKKRLYCLPTDGVRNEQLARIITTHLKSNPKDLNQSARINVLAALINAFPCKK